MFIFTPIKKNISASTSTSKLLSPLSLYNIVNTFFCVICHLAFLSVIKPGKKAAQKSQTLNMIIF